MERKVLIGGVTIVALVFIIVGFVFRLNNNKDKINVGDNPIVEGNNNQNETKNFVCTYESNDRGIKTTETYTFTHVNDKLKNYSLVLKYEYSKETEELAFRYKGDSIKGQVEEAKNVDGIDVTHIDENYVITNSYSYDLVKLNSLNYGGDSNILPIYNLNDSVSSIVKEVKSWKFSCKES